MTTSYTNAFDNRELYVSDDGEFVTVDLTDNDSTFVCGSFSPAVAREIATEMMRLADVLDPQQPASADQGKGSYVAVYSERGDWGGGPTLSLLTDDDGDLIASFDGAVEEMTDYIARAGVSAVEVVELAVVRRAVVRRTVEVLVA